jgi:hypothetical protein
MRQLARNPPGQRCDSVIGETLVARLNNTFRIDPETIASEVIDKYHDALLSDRYHRNHPA